MVEPMILTVTTNQESRIKNQESREMLLKDKKRRTAIREGGKTPGSTKRDWVAGNWGL